MCAPLLARKQLFRANVEHHLADWAMAGSSGDCTFNARCYGRASGKMSESQLCKSDSLSQVDCLIMHHMIDQLQYLDRRCEGHAIFQSRYNMPSSVACQATGAGQADSGRYAPQIATCSCIHHSQYHYYVKSKWKRQVHNCTPYRLNRQILVLTLVVC